MANLDVGEVLMASGKYRTRVLIQTQTETPDGSGGSTTALDAGIERWADWMPERGRERLEAGRIAAPLAGVLRLRYSSQVASMPEQRTVVTIDSKPYNVRSIEPNQRKQYIEMTLERGVAI